MLEEEVESVRQFRQAILDSDGSVEPAGQFVLHYDDFTAGNILVDGGYEVVGVAN